MSFLDLNLTEKKSHIKALLQCILPLSIGLLLVILLLAVKHLGYTYIASLHVHFSVGYWYLVWMAAYCVVVPEKRAKLRKKETFKEFIP